MGMIHLHENITVFLYIFYDTVMHLRSKPTLIHLFKNTNEKMERGLNLFLHFKILL